MLSALAFATVLFTAKPADTLSGVAQQHNTAWEAVYDHNQSATQSPNPAHVGHKHHVVEADRTKAHPHVHAATTHSSTSTHSVSASAGSSGSGYDSSALGDIPGVPSSFAACVAYRESTNDTNPAANGNAYGIIPASGYSVSGDSIAQQKQVFKQIYDTSGPRAWAADGC